MIYIVGLKHMGTQTPNTQESLLTVLFEINTSFPMENSFRTTYLIDASIHH